MEKWKSTFLMNHSVHSNILKCVKGYLQLTSDLSQF